MDLSDVIIAPVLTEKSSNALALQKVTLKVRTDATKVLIKMAVEQRLGAKVERVNLINVIGKKRRLGRFLGQKADWKKAIVTLKAGEKITLMEGLLS